VEEGGGGGACQCTGMAGGEREQEQAERGVGVEEVKRGRSTRPHTSFIGT
jgi:hypothetical protein